LAFELFFCAEKKWTATLSSGAAVSPFAEEASTRVQASFRKEINQEIFEFTSFDESSKSAMDAKNFFDSW
jgi:hypothetical protein